jgi:FMN phosphatase YigB (HAD superfamily)
MPGTLPPRALLFDAGNTLLRMDYEALARRLGQAGRPVTAEQVEEAELRARVRLDPHLAPGTSTEGDEIQRRYLGYALEALGIADPALLDEIDRWRRSFNPPVGLWTRAAPDARAALGAARRAGCVTGVVSNSDGSVAAILEAAGLGGDLAFVLDSAVVGVEKPDPGIFRLALDRAGVGAGEAVYVGDLYSVDVLGARGAGLGAVLLDPRGFWGPRDCPRAGSLSEAVALALG